MNLAAELLKSSNNTIQNKINTQKDLQEEFKQLAIQSTQNFYEKLIENIKNYVTHSETKTIALWFRLHQNVSLQKYGWVSYDTHLINPIENTKLHKTYFDEDSYTGYLSLKYLVELFEKDGFLWKSWNITTADTKSGRSERNTDYFIVITWDSIWPEDREIKHILYLDEINNFSDNDNFSNNNYTYNENSRSIPKGLRYDILRRDGFKCKICGRSAADGIKLHVDHIIPFSKGGKTTPSNLRTLCQECNIGKSNKIENNVIPLFINN